MTTARSLPAIAIAMLAATAPAAAQSGARILGLTSLTPLVQSQDLTTCAPSFCAPLFPPTIAPCAGGTAYDTVTRGTWITDGLSIARVDSRSTACTFQCPPVPVPFVSATVYATGLAHEHGANRLWITYSDNFIRVFQIAGCTLSFAFQCAPPVPVGMLLTGIAYDDVNTRVYYSAAVCPGSAPGGLVFCASALTPCAPNCAFPLQVSITGIPFQALTGVAYDACRDQVWVTDGPTAESFVITSLINCQFQQLQTCANPSILDPYVGLCIEPSTEQSVGGPCSSPTCPPCLPVQFFANGDPVLGNLAFSIDGASLPANTTAATVLAFGPCTPPGFLVPPFCGPILFNATGVIGAFPLLTGGTVGCTGATSLNVSIPPVPPLCGLVLSSQIIGTCLASGAIGTYMSDCLSWMITSS